MRSLMIVMLAGSIAHASPLPDSFERPRVEEPPAIAVVPSPGDARASMIRRRNFGGVLIVVGGLSILSGLALEAAYFGREIEILGCQIQVGVFDGLATAFGAQPDPTPSRCPTTHGPAYWGTGIGLLLGGAGIVSGGVVAVTSAHSALKLKPSLVPLQGGAGAALSFEF